MSTTESETLEPTLTKWDKRVLGTLGEWPPHPTWPLERLPWLDVWTVARALREDDVAMVRRTLDGLAHLRYATATGWSYHRKWIRTPWAREAASWLEARGV